MWENDMLDRHDERTIKAKTDEVLEALRKNLDEHIEIVSVVTDEALTQAAKELRQRGTITVRDAEGETHHTRVTDVEVTERGIEATLHMTSVGFDQLTRQPVSMGCKIP